jgi:hypothetical protein
MKRKYTRHAPQSNSEPIKEESGISTLVKDRPVTFEDLPLSVRASVERTIAYRKRLALPDDSKERKQRAVEYFVGPR